MSTVTLPQGTIHYRDVGPKDAPILVFVHGLLVSGSLWDGVVDRLSSDFRCIVPDWPLGSHREAMHPDADLTGTARAGGIVVTMSATITSSSIDGTYSVGEAGACSNDSGTFTSSR